MRDTVLEQYLAKMGFLRDDYIGAFPQLSASIHHFDEVGSYQSGCFLQQPRADAFAPVFLLDSYLGQITCMHIEDTMTYHFAVKESTETD